MPNSLDHERYCAEIVEQTRLFREALQGADLAATVPTCPDWTLRELAVHLGGAHRWAAEIVRRRAQGPVPDEEVPGRHGPPEGGAGVDAWLAEGAGLLAQTLRASGPEAEVWSYFPNGRAAFYGRRMAHETAVHRADACLAVGVPYTVDAALALDTVDEWLEIVSSEAARTYKKELGALDSRAGDTIHLHATDVEPAADGSGSAEWVLEIEDGGIGWRHAHEKSTVALRGPLTELLLAFQRRIPVTAPGLEVIGDADLLDLWLAKTAF
ncbi:maleylpyruvate isomerase family mycothiol-dependent enzyme [Streptomyces sp. HNM0574]|uniref:maleylpyruvate isomerase family mycothiol-dependent enzyme n=1 Tax=Streptomyces sp. HNM0574 TaxID=2714954 RepID=UPI001469E5E9|nr:maleylpyruvate isomerase family mycothiol-dependent enzyme [Streptomyces sp. HNM0574]NLU67968.1 maleylpyruvate isomerase family mycothiol-dependent enzyme [Streptomyces sp. HNM0574]